MRKPWTKLLLLLLLLTTRAFAQTVVIDPATDGGFESGADFTSNGWTVVNGTNTTKMWFVGTGQTGFSGARAAFIGNNATTVGNDGAARTVHFYKSITLPVGATNISLSFKLKHTPVDNNWDYSYVALSTATPANGTVPGGIIYTNSATNYTTFTTQSVTIPNTNATGTPINLIFTFKSDGATPNTFVAFDDISLTYVTPVPCTGNPAASTAQASTANACPNTPFNLSLTGGPVAGTTGISYQWHSSPAGLNNFQPIAGATAGTYTVTNQTAATDYYCALTCTNAGGGTTNSATVAVGQNSFVNCYCTPSANNCSSEWIKNVQIGGLTNPTNPTSCSGGYNNFTGTVAAVSLMQTTGYPISVLAHTNDNNSQVGVWIDYDHSGSFEASEFQLLGTMGAANTDFTFNNTITIPGTALLGNTRMRVRSSNSSGVAGTSACGLASGSGVWGEIEDYLVNIVAPVACSGTPSGGTAAASVTTACPNTNITLSASGMTIAAGLSYQWKVSTDGGTTWSPVAGGTTNPFTLTGQTLASQYHLVVTCGASGLSDSSANVSVAQTAQAICQTYCTPTYTSDCSTHRFTNVTLGSINNSPTGCTVNNYTHLSTTLNAGVATPISMTTNGYVGVAVVADFNNDGDFNDANETLIPTNYIPSDPAVYNLSLTVPASVPAGAYRLRTLNAGANAGGTGAGCGSYAYGTYHDYIINVNAAVFCAGTPAPGNTLAAATSFCVSGSTTLSLQDPASTVAGITYQWQQYDNSSSSWVNINLATNATYTTPVVTASTQYRCGVTCAATTSTGYSNPVTLVINALPAVSVSPVQAAFCNAASVPLTASGAVTYAWSPVTDLSAATGATVNASPVGAATYTVTGTDANGCTNTATTTVAPITAIKPVAGVAPGTISCAAGTPVTVNVTPIASPAGSMEYQLTDDLENVVAAWQSSTAFSITPATAGTHIYHVYARNTDCPGSVTATPGIVPVYTGFTGAVTGTNATCVNNDGKLTVMNVFGPDGPGNPLWYTNDFSTTTLDTTLAALRGVATITSGGVLQLTPNATSQNGGLLIKNPLGITTNVDSVKFLLSVPTSGADGVSWSFGDDVSYNSAGALECGAGTKLIVAFDAYGTSGTGVAGIYLTYGQAGGTAISPTVTSTMLAYSGNTSWRAASNTQIAVYITTDGKLTLKVGTTTVFNEVQLPASYVSANRATWKHLFAARTGGVSELHAIDNLNIYYRGPSYVYGASAAHSNVVPASWQSSNVFSGLAGGDSLDVWVASAANPAACNKNLGTYGISAPVVASLLDSGDPGCVGAEDGYIALGVNTPGTYNVTYTKNGGSPVTLTGIGSSTGADGEYVLFNVPEGVYTNMKLTSSASCVSNIVPGPLTLTGTAATAIVTGSSSNVMTQPGAGTQYYTDASCNLIAGVTSANNLGSVTAAVTVGSTALISPSNSEPFVGRYYEITPTMNSTLPGQVKLYFSATDFAAYNASSSVGSTYPAILPDGSNLRVTAFHGPASGGTTGPNGSYNAANADLIQPVSVVLTAGGWWEVVVTSPNGFSGFFANTNTNTSLNVTLGTISAKNTGAQNQVNWDTKAEKTGDYFDVERSKDGRNFSKIGSQPAKGTAPGNYVFIDSKPFSGVNYYRLQMVNADGSIVYSKVVNAAVSDGTFAFSVFPNPVNSQLKVDVSAVLGKGIVSVTDLTGRVLLSKEITANGAVTIPVDQLSAGIYLVKYQDEAHAETIKISKH